jgi:hypothetical protein
VMNKTVSNFVLHFKRFFEVERVSSLDLFENDCHAEWAQASNLLADLSSKLCLTLLDSLIDVLNGISIEDAVYFLNLWNRIIERVEIRMIHYYV